MTGVGTATVTYDGGSGDLPVRRARAISIFNWVLMDHSPLMAKELSIFAIIGDLLKRTTSVEMSQIGFRISELRPRVAKAIGGRGLQRSVVCRGVHFFKRNPWM